MADLTKKVDFQQKYDELKQKANEIQGLPESYKAAIAFVEAAKSLGPLELAGRPIPIYCSDNGV